MTDLPTVTLLAAFLAGIVSFLSPCVLPLVPGYVSFIVGRTPEQLQAGRDSRELMSAFVVSLFFILGFSAVFIALGASASAIGRLFAAYRYEANIVGGVIIILFGLYMTGLFKSRLLSRDTRFQARVQGGTPLSAFVMGLAFAFGWTPCIGPILGAILAMTAVSTGVDSGMMFLAVYSLGLGVPFMLTALFTSRLVTHVALLRRIGRPLHVGAGILLIIMGIAMITGYLSMFGIWLLNTFPFLLNIG
ncbi:MAG TPA: cytochrome c biogenesis protein CcdA [Sedimenticola thiotaurini]|uniref:Cytochrome c biogenesis protein CcdA n=1 Tax=Sedimenticola thiotaurini TaxID=1543721 RepID=A0A831RRZ6_9GAMM|nr:cytochrome c biogenesis protein CcdA [Sedimenticola thiotaurini]